MLLLHAQNLEKYYGERCVLSVEDVKLYEGERVGIVGANGAGKTTLLRLLLGLDEPDGGRVERRGRYTYIDQLGWSADAADRRMLRVFSVADKDAAGPVSGGEATRLKIAAALSTDAPLLAADEPTANLDLEGIETLCAQLEAYSGALLLISHDRAVLDRLCSRIWEVEDGAVRDYPGNYSEYRAQAEQRRARRQFEYEQYREEKWRLEQSVLAAKTRAAKVKKAPKRMGNSEARLHKRAAGESQEKISGAAKALESRLAQLEAVEKPRELEAVRIDFARTDPPVSRQVIAAERLSFSYGPRRIFDNAAFAVPNGEKVAVVGANGAGKTTLLRLLLEGDAAIRVAPKVRFGYFAQRFENLDFSKSILDNVLETAVQPQSVVRTVLARLLFRREDVFKPVSVLSGGELIKVSVAQLVVSACNVLVLDEPTNYLDIPSIEVMQQVLRDYEGAVLFVSHDRRFIDALADRLLIVRDGKIESFAGNYTAWEQARERPKQAGSPAQQKLLLELRIAELAARISSNPGDREALEDEWQALVEQKRALE